MINSIKVHVFIFEVKSVIKSCVSFASKKPYYLSEYFYTLIPTIFSIRLYPKFLLKLLKMRSVCNIQFRFIAFFETSRDNA